MRTALVVDDNAFHRELLEVFLGTMGFSQVWTCEGPDDAKAAFRGAAPKPSIVIIDHELGPADGLRLLREMASEDDSIRAIFMSRDPEVERECYKAGALEFVRKPYSIMEVGRAVNRAMRPTVVS
ncbi:MAG: response regulator [Thermoplasmata archaeon]|nr:response regulator [Thermoplasmata archaeon]NIS13873.1 response regulator [Thermoplasmata archaeon]NIS21714.1 response regulator [Thermoplasmata archaeon]NIT79308.1 response regulator [Thermoplasmata archaeon]NIU50747.1 response regulator [Thermoplasmata archaeon]